MAFVNFLKNLQLFFILEIASAHGGSVDRLKKIFNAALNSQADFVKLQIFNKICSIYLTRRIDSKPLGGFGRDLMP